MPAKPIGFNRFALIAIRDAHEVTQDRVATDADCDPGHYSKIEKGTRSPSLELALQIAKALDCDIRALIPGYVAEDIVESDAA